jgi:hypothetical protein
VVARHVDVRERWFRIREVEADMSLQYCDRQEESSIARHETRGVARGKEGRSGETPDLSCAGLWRRMVSMGTAA